jgi:hypothetical protein
MRGAGLCRHIGRADPALIPVRRNRCRDDNAASAPCLHMIGGALDGGEHGVQVDGQNAVPMRVGNRSDFAGGVARPVQRDKTRTTANAGVSEHDIEAAAFICDRVNAVPQLNSIAHVDDFDQDARTGLSKAVGGCLKTVPVDVEQRYPCAGFRDRQPDAARGPGHEGWPKVKQTDAAGRLRNAAN